MNYEVVYCIGATERSQPHQRTTSTNNITTTVCTVKPQYCFVSNYLLFSTPSCASVWRFVYRAQHATDHIMTKFITYATKGVLLRHRNVAAIRTIQTVLLTAPSTEATCVRDVSAFCNVPVPLMTVSSLVYLTNDTKFSTVF